MTADDVNLSKFLVPVLAYVHFLPLFHLLSGLWRYTHKAVLFACLKVPVLTECTYEMY